MKFSRQGGKISKGIVKYAGHLPGKNDMYLGVELEKEGKEKIYVLATIIPENKIMQ